MKYQALCVLESRNKGGVWGLWIWAYWTMDFIGVVCHLVLFAGIFTVEATGRIRRELDFVEKDGVIGLVLVLLEQCGLHMRELLAKAMQYFIGPGKVFGFVRAPAETSRQADSCGFHWQKLGLAPGGQRIIIFAVADI